MIVIFREIAGLIVLNFFGSYLEVLGKENEAVTDVRRTSVCISWSHGNFIGLQVALKHLDGRDGVGCRGARASGVSGDV